MKTNEKICDEKLIQDDHYEWLDDDGALERSWNDLATVILGGVILMALAFAWVSS